MGTTMAAMADDVPTLSDEDQAALRDWLQATGLGSRVDDVEPLTGGSQNIVVRLRVDGRPMVLRRPPQHPRPTSDRTMLREIAVLKTLAGTRCRIRNSSRAVTISTCSAWCST